MKKKTKQNTLDNHSLNIRIHNAIMPKKMKKDRQRRVFKNKLVDIKRITKCNRCGKPLNPIFGSSLCGECLKQWDIQKWARSLTRHHKGKATKCMKCGLVSHKNIEWHHWDYEKPLDVISLCKKCHGLAHRVGREEFDKINVKKRMKTIDGDY